jgi:O-antigen/teichoic acid export membrane protein
MNLLAPIFTKINSLKNSEFVSNVSLLAAGSLMAQSINILSAPIQTRLYSPENFAIFGIYTAILSSLVPAVGGRYEVASVVVKEEKEGLGLYALSIWTALLISTFIFLAFIFWQHELVQILGAQSLGIWWYFLPFAIFFTALNSSVTHFENRQKNYKLITKVLIIQTSVVTLFLIILGVSNFSSVANCFNVTWYINGFVIAI